MAQNGQENEAETVFGIGYPDDDMCNCKSHGPSVQDVAKLTSIRETVALIASIAIRPCTGAIFLLVIAWQMELKLAGAIAVAVMGLGTATFTSLVALSSVAARGAALMSFEKPRMLGFWASSLQILSGALILWISLQMLGIANG